MPSGEVHHRIHSVAWPAAVALTVASVFVLRDYASGLGCALGYAMGRWVDPDLDEMGVTQAEGRMVNELPVVGWVFYGYWSIYGAAFRRHHRSFWTHFPVASTVIRLVYMFWWTVPLILRLEVGWQASVGMLVAGLLIGLSFADGLHWAADVMSGEIRRLR